MLQRIHELYSDLHRHRVMLAFSGALSEDLIAALLAALEKKLIGLEPDARARRRVFNATMECLQNLYHHHSDAATTPDDRGMLMVAQGADGWNVLTGNLMAAAEVERLRSHIEHVNALDADGLRAMYKETLGNGRYSAHGGGGLGLIDIARKSGRKLEYGFVPHDSRNTFFSLHVNLPGTPTEHLP